LWSVGQYIGNTGAVHAGYLRSTLLATPLENDHVRFSWMVAFAILMGGWLLREKRGIVSGTGRVVLLVITVLLVGYLHLLAVRTGLVALYAMLLFLGVWLLWHKGTRRLALVILPGTLLLAFALFALFPTLQNRWRYVRYDYGFFSKAHYKEGMNDAVRVVSIKAGWSLMNRLPVGTGFGDLAKETRKWYAEHYPGMLEKDQILPGSEAVVYGAACGWTGLLVVAFVLLLPFFSGKNLLWLLAGIVTAPGLVFDIALEVQFGVFMYGFTLLFFQGWVLQMKREEDQRQ
jgi:O-antigen ligase